MMMVNNWDDIEDVLFDGTSEEIQNLKCPTCDSKIYFSYTSEGRTLKYGCKSCGKQVVANGCHDIPNCGAVN